MDQAPFWRFSSRRWPSWPFTAVSGGDGRARVHQRRVAQPARDRPLRRDLRGEPQLRQPVRRLGGRERPEHADAAHTTQVDQTAAAATYACLKQDDIEPPGTVGRALDGAAPTPRRHARRLVPEPFRERAVPDRRLPRADGHDVSAEPARRSAFPNGRLKRHHSAHAGSRRSPGGCTRDIVHRFYQEQYQLNGGHQDRYAGQSDAGGLRWARTTRRRCPSTSTSTAAPPEYAILDNFFQGAFGGSFLNHQWLIAAATPVDHRRTAARRTRRTVLDRNGFPTLRLAAASNRRRDGRRSTPGPTSGLVRPADAGLRPPTTVASSPAATTASTRCSPVPAVGLFGASSRRRRPRRSATG